MFCYDKEKKTEKKYIHDHKKNNKLISRTADA